MVISNEQFKEMQIMASGTEEEKAGLVRQLRKPVETLRDIGIVSCRNARSKGFSQGDDVPMALALVHSEVSEALEGFRKDLMDDHLPHRSMLECELADVIIRVAGLAEDLGLDLQGAIQEKLVYNETRKDHDPETRVKKF